MPDQLGSYRIIRQIGRGGQGTVYLAEDTRLGRYVALKAMDPGFAADPVAVERFRREAEITSRLDHPGICTVYETGETGSILWIAMRFVEGVSLAKKVATARDDAVSRPTSTMVMIDESSSLEEEIQQRPAPWERTGPTTWPDITRLLALFEEAARALHAAHEVGVIHRDIKPGNMMVTPERRVVILDFGLAVDVSSEHPALTRTGELMGTKEYMSPEQITAQVIKLDRRTDVYSLGVSLFECLTLRRPFEAPTREGLYQAILTKTPPDLRRLNAAIPDDLRIVVATAIEKDRDRRYQTALDLAEELRRVRMHEPIMAKPVGPLVRLQRWAQRNPGLAAAIGGLFAALAMGLAVALVLLGQRDRALAEVTTERNDKQSALSNYDRLGDSSRLQRLRTDADALWPAEPSKIAAMKAWVDQGTQLAARLDGHQELLRTLRESGQALPPDSRPGESRPADSRAVWRFSTDAEQFKHDTTAQLVSDLTAFVDPNPKKGLLADMKERLAFAESVEQETLAKPAAIWAEAVQSIRDVKACPKYGGLEIKPQLGLIPIGRNEQGLWEFVHLQTAAPGAAPVPERGPDGRIVVTEEMGIVFVLIPGGAFRMGAMKPDDDAAPTDPNVDPDAEDEEAPITPVRLDPFFLSKYEMTQGQWRRCTGRNPSQYGPGSRSGDHANDLRDPVEQVSWLECDLWLGRLGLMLPTEAQWEYAARAGTTTPRWTGLGGAGLDKAANVADVYFKQHGGPTNIQYEAWDDGYGLHAPVGSFAPNPFGLHDVLGNVWEWCRDWRGNYAIEPRAGDGLRSPPEHHSRVFRGGAFNYTASNVRSACRYNNPPQVRYGNLGVRPARACTKD